MGLTSRGNTMCFFKRKPKEENLLFDIPKAELMSRLREMIQPDDKMVKTNIIEESEDVLHYDVFVKAAGIKQELHAEYKFTLSEESEQTKVDVEVNGDSAKGIRKYIIKELNKQFKGEKK